jgi:hypothetical protein
MNADALGRPCGANGNGKRQDYPQMAQIGTDSAAAPPERQGGEESEERPRQGHPPMNPSALLRAGLRHGGDVVGWGTQMARIGERIPQMEGLAPAESAGGLSRKP